MEKTRNEKTSFAQELWQLKEKIRKAADNSSVAKKLHISGGECIYLVCFILILIYKFMQTTMVDITFMFYAIPALITFFSIALAIKIIVFDVLEPWDYIRFVLPEAYLYYLFVIVGQNSADKFIPLYFLMIIAARRVDFRKIAAIGCAICGIMTAVILVLSQLGIVYDRVDDTAKGLRHCFGIIYTTDFAAHVCFVLLLWFWLRKGRLRWFEDVIMAAITAAVLYYTRSYLDVICMAMIIAADLYFKLFPGKRLIKALKTPIAWSMVILTAFALFIALFYHPGNPFESFLNDHFLSLHQRCYISYDTLREYGLTLFGQSIHDVGVGAWHEVPKDLVITFIDISYLRILFKNGIFSLFMVLTWFTWLARKQIRKGDYVTAAVFFIIAVNSTVAHHLVDFSYNIFLLGLVADFTGYDRALSAAEESCRLKPHKEK